MKVDFHKIAALILVLILAFAAFAFLLLNSPATSRYVGDTVPTFTAKDYKNATVSLSNTTGRFVVLHITQFEDPMCLGCESYVIGQLLELEKLAAQENRSIEIITLNLRKNAYSPEGWRLANESLGLNISWGWIEELPPYPITSQYIKYAQVEGEIANPAIVLIDKELRILDISLDYSIGKGKIDGVQTSEVIQSNLAELSSGISSNTGSSSGESLTFGGMLALGVLTSFSPCAIALLLAMIAYIGSTNEREGAHTSARGRVTQGVAIGASFTLGMSLVFMLIGLSIAYVGEFLRSSSLFFLLAGALLIILGVNSIHSLSKSLALLRKLARNETQNVMERRKGGFVERGRRTIVKTAERSRYLAAFLLGILFTIGWAPCALSLVFPVIVLMTTQEVSVLTGGALMFVFGLGHGLVIIPFSAATGEMKGRIGNRFIKAGRWISISFGFVVIALGVVFAARYFGFYLW